MPTGLTTRIDIDSHGVAWIAGTSVKVKEVALDKLAYGWSPEEMHFQHPQLSLAHIHAALAYYYENQDRLDDDIRRDVEEADRMAGGPPSALQSKLRTLRSAR